MNTLTNNELMNINGGLPMEAPPPPSIGESLINWAERWYWELTH
jgi:bacteriocin-like protein